MNLTELKEKMPIKSLPGLLKKVKEALPAFFSKAVSLPKRLFASFTGYLNGGQEDQPEARRKRLIIIFAGVAGALIFAIIISVAINAARPRSGGVSNIAVGLSIPVEEFFVPSEPDFLPGFIPEREPRFFWSLEEIRQYWKVPENSNWWRGEIKTTIDKLMEGVP